MESFCYDGGMEEAQTQEELEPKGQSGALPTRRRVLKWGLAGVGTLAMAGVGGTGALLALRGRAPKVEGLKVLNAQEYRTICAIAQTHLPVEGLFPLSAKDFEIGRLFDAFLAGEAEENVTQLKQALLLFEYGPLVYDHKWATFSNLPNPERLKHWQSWIVNEDIMRRQVAMILRKFMSLVFFDQPKVWPEISYPVPRFSGVPEK